MLKELTVKEALQLLAEKYPEPVEVKTKNGDNCKLLAVTYDRNFTIDKPMCVVGDVNKVYIEVEPEYRYMTQQEIYDWCCTIGSVGYQVEAGDNIWMHPVHRYYDCKNIGKYKYRTIQEIDGKIVYSEPQEFKVRVE